MWSSYCRKTVGVAVALTTVLSAPQIAQAQLSCSGFMDPTIVSPPTSPGNTYDIGDTVTINLRFGPESINGGSEIAISSILFCLDGGSLGACADEGAVISYDGDATTSTDCVDGSGGAITVVSNNPGGGTLPNEIEFTFEDTNGDPTTIVIPTSGECNISFDVTILNFGTDGSPFSVQQRAIFDGDCDNGLKGGAVGTLAIPLFHNPMINIDKESSITSICDGVETSVTYFYDVTNPGNVCLENVVVTDDTCGPVNFTGGDIGSDGILCPGEIWTYTCTTSISQATTNIATASGESVVNGQSVQDTDDAFVDASAPPTVEVTRPASENCEGEPPKELCAVVTGGRPPYSYEWTGPNGFTATTECINVENLVENSGDYCVTVTDDNGCVDSDCGSLVVNEGKLVTVSPPSATLCEGGSQEFCAVVLGGTPPYSYLWSNGATTECITVAAAGEYCVTVTDANGCFDTDCGNLFIEENPLCSVDPPSGDRCEDGPGVEFCAVPAGGTAPFTYAWEGPNGFLASTECITVTDDGEYCVVVTDANGCVSEPCCATLNVHLNPSCIVTAIPPVGEDCPIELCAEVTGGRPPFSYLWSTGETTQCISVDPSDPTVFSVTVTDDNGCTTDCELLVECPQGGGQGCTPGYWKQPHHFDDWTDPYDPDDLFSDHFDDAFPGKTLLQVLSQPASSSPGPNSLNNLGRHTVAALLNAANPDVSYFFSEQDVIDMFNDVYPGSESDYQDLKNIFSAENEAGCPLNNSDLNGDFAVDGTDLGILFGNWGGTGIGDINESGVVDAFDLAELLSSWTS